jgi:hypothetical protein
MAFVPYEQMTIETAQPPATVATKMAGHIEPRRWIRIPFSQKYETFEGTVGEDGFEINRIINYRNSFLPQIKGRFESLRPGTRIIITMKLHPLVLAFMIVWCGGTSFAAIVSLPSFVATGDDLLKFIPLAMFVFGYLLCTLAFKWEARKARHYLSRILLDRDGS